MKMQTKPKRKASEVDDFDPAPHKFIEPYAARYLPHYLPSLLPLYLLPWKGEGKVPVYLSQITTTGKFYGDKRSPNEAQTK